MLRMQMTLDYCMECGTRIPSGRGKNRRSCVQRRLASRRWHAIKSNVYLPKTIDRYTSYICQLPTFVIAVLSFCVSPLNATCPDDWDITVKMRRHNPFKQSKWSEPLCHTHGYGTVSQKAVALVLIIRYISWNEYSSVDEISIQKVSYLFCLDRHID